MDQEYSYEFEYDDYYCYKNKVLKNRLHIRDKQKLKDAEREITILKAGLLVCNQLQGKFDMVHLLEIHRVLFEDVYVWAGEIRTVNIAKGHPFCLVPFIEPQLKAVFEELKDEKYLKGVKSKKELAKRLAYYISEINAIHPFREIGRAHV